MTPTIKKGLLALQSEDYEITDAYGFPMILKRLDDLTCFCTPQFRKAGPEIHIDYYVCLAVLQDRKNREDCFERALDNREYLTSLRTYPLEAFKHTFTKDGLASDWLREDIAEYVDSYSVGAEVALSKLSTTDDRTMRKFGRAFEQAYNDIIVSPLRWMIETGSSGEQQ